MKCRIKDVKKIDASHIEKKVTFQEKKLEISELAIPVYMLIIM